MTVEQKYHEYVEKAKHSPSGKELINVATVFFDSGDKQAAAFIRHALAQGEIKKNPVKPGHYIV